MRSESPTLLVCFGAAVRSRRVGIGLSQERLAELAGLHRTYVGDVERGERNVSLVNIERLAVALGLQASELLSAAESRRQA